MRDKNKWNNKSIVIGTFTNGRTCRVFKKGIKEDKECTKAFNHIMATIKLEKPIVQKSGEVWTSKRGGLV